MIDEDVYYQEIMCAYERHDSLYPYHCIIKVVSQLKSEYYTSDRCANNIIFTNILLVLVCLFFHNNSAKVPLSSASKAIIALEFTLLLKSEKEPISF